jgi:hypothetical protein
MSANSPGDLNAEFQQILAHYQQSVTAQFQTAKNTLRTAILPALMASGVANVEAAYSGYGDSGAIDGVQFRDKSGVRVERDKIPTALTEQLENVLYEFLPAGFEINEGGQGTLTLDVQTGTVKLQHEENYTESTSSINEWEV